MFGKRGIGQSLFQLSLKSFLGTGVSLVVYRTDGNKLIEKNMF